MTRVPAEVFEAQKGGPTFRVVVPIKVYEDTLDGVAAHLGKLIGTSDLHLRVGAPDAAHAIERVEQGLAWAIVLAEEERAVLEAAEAAEESVPAEP